MCFFLFLKYYANFEIIELPKRIKENYKKRYNQLAKRENKGGNHDKNSKK